MPRRTQISAVKHRTSLTSQRARGGTFDRYRRNSSPYGDRDRLCLPQRRTSPIALPEYLLERIEKAERDNIFITVTPARARKEAEAAEARYRRRRPLSVLDGVPIAWKDLFDVADAPTTGGSLLFGAKTPKERDLVCVANAAAAGMVCMGKLNLSELAYSGLGLNPHFGTPVNPNDRNAHRSPGGSSSGSGAAVAAGLVPCAVGADTGGSVRIPASFNGVFGFKTSEGRSGATSADLNSSCRKTWFATRRDQRSWRISSARWTRSDEPAQPSLGVRSMQSTRLPT